MGKIFRKQQDINEQQFGFREGRSCVTNLISFYSRVIDIVQERDGWADCVYVDLKKAFDKVPYKRHMETQTCRRCERPNIGLDDRFFDKKRNKNNIRKAKGGRKRKTILKIDKERM